MFNVEKAVEVVIVAFDVGRVVEVGLLVVFDVGRVGEVGLPVVFDAGKAVVLVVEGLLVVEAKSMTV